MVEAAGFLEERRLWEVRSLLVLPVPSRLEERRAGWEEEEERRLDDVPTVERVLSGVC